MTNTEQCRAEHLEEGDTIIVDGEEYIVADLRENARMDGMWVEYTKDIQCTGASMFLHYDEMVMVVS